jgi:NAD+ kinase
VTRVGFILKPKQDNEARSLLNTLADWVTSNGHQAVVVAEDGGSPQGAIIVPEDELGASVDLCVVLGGDGTMLRASRAVTGQDIPLLGINLGHLGFLNPFDASEALTALADAVAGKLPSTSRMRLQVTYRPRGGKPILLSALNDVVVNQGAMARLIELQAHLDGAFINSYRADGLVVCTPTGSSAYNLAAGGPIMYPGLNAIAITPICAQGLNNRPLVVPGHRIVRLSMDADCEGAVLTLDGQWAHSFQTGDVVDITSSPTGLTIYNVEADYFNVLRAKLHWGVRPGEDRR